MRVYAHGGECARVSFFRGPDTRFASKLKRLECFVGVPHIITHPILQLLHFEPLCTYRQHDPVAPGIQKIYVDLELSGAMQLSNLRTT